MKNFIELKIYKLSLRKSLKLGTCLPQKCTTEDIISIINFAIDIIPFNLTDIDSTYVTCQEPKSLDKPAILAM